jgi:hypothetical protein
MSIATTTRRQSTVRKLTRTDIDNRTPVGCIVRYKGEEYGCIDLRCVRYLHPNGMIGIRHCLVCVDGMGNVVAFQVCDYKKLMMRK